MGIMSGFFFPIWVNYPFNTKQTCLSLLQLLLLVVTTTELSTHYLAQVVHWKPFLTESIPRAGDRFALMPMASLVYPIHCMLFEGRGNQITWRKPMLTLGEHASSTQLKTLGLTRTQIWETSGCEEIELSTEPPWIQKKLVLGQS